MTFISKILYSWHRFRMNYHYLLVESCLDSELKGKLIKKLEYHKNQVMRLTKDETESLVSLQVSSPSQMFSRKK